MVTELLSLLGGQVGWRSQRGDGREVNAESGGADGWYQRQDIQTVELVREGVPNFV